MSHVQSVQPEHNCDIACKEGIYWLDDAIQWSRVFRFLLKPQA